MRLWLVAVTEPKAFRERQAWRTEFIVQSTSSGGAERAVRREHPALFRDGTRMKTEPLDTYAVKHLSYRVKA